MKKTYKKCPKCDFEAELSAATSTRNCPKCQEKLEYVVKGSNRRPREAGVTPDMVSTAFELPGYRVVRNIGIVRGITVRSRSVFGSFFAGLQTIFGGNISLMTSLCERARIECYDLMCDQAERHGANAIIGMRYESNDIAVGVTEMLSYGTAVVVEAIEE